MERFNVKCADHYPMKCNLSPADKDYLLTKEKFKAFFILQYKDQDEWLMPTIETYFSERAWRLFNAGKEGGTGTKFCNICRYALASNFGIVALTPLNYNVFQEIGLMQGLQKQLLYILNPERLKAESKKIPFDMDDQIYVEHNNKSSLLAGLDKKIPLVLNKIQLQSGFELEKRKYIKNKLKKMNPATKEILKLLVLVGPRKFFHNYIGVSELVNFIKEHPNLEEVFLQELINSDFILFERMPSYVEGNYYLNENYRTQLEELLWED